MDSESNRRTKPINREKIDKPKKNDKPIKTDKPINTDKPRKELKRDLICIYIRNGNHTLNLRLSLWSGPSMLSAACPSQQDASWARRRVGGLVSVH